MQYWPALAIVALAGLPSILIPGFLVDVIQTGDWKRSGIRDLGVALVAGAELHFLLRTTRRYQFLSTLQHEVSHLIAGLAVGACPQDLRVTGGSGLISYHLAGPQRPSRTFLIAIAPYWFCPLILVPILVFAVADGPVPQWVRLTMTGITGMALVLAISQTRLSQPDLAQNGRGLALTAVIWLWLATAVVVLFVLATGSFKGVPELYVSAYQTLVEGLQWVRLKLLHLWQLVR